jgi:hypothetical protein
MDAIRQAAMTQADTASHAPTPIVIARARARIQRALALCQARRFWRGALCASGALMQRLLPCC